MKRMHLFEWEDQPWLPRVFRDYITDHLHHAMVQGRMFHPIVPMLHETLEQIGEDQIVDLCSGGGGPFPELADQLQQKHGKQVKVVMTDLFPNQSVVEQVNAEGNAHVHYRPESTSAFDLPDDLRGCFTIFTALHHFRPDAVRELMESMAKQRCAIAVFEVTERNLKTMIKMMLFTVLSSFIATPRVGNLTLKRLFWTYLIPLAPLLYTWDGAISCLRTYTPDDLNSLTSGSDHQYTWKTGIFRATNQLGPYNITFMLGVPQPAE